jgi:hypothetical protein
VVLEARLSNSWHAQKISPSCSNPPSATPASCSIATKLKGDDSSNAIFQSQSSRKDAFAVMMDSARTKRWVPGTKPTKPRGSVRAACKAGSVLSAFDWAEKTGSAWILTFCRWAKDPELLIREEPSLYVSFCSSMVPDLWCILSVHGCIKLCMAHEGNRPANNAA